MKQFAPYVLFALISTSCYKESDYDLENRDANSIIVELTAPVGSLLANNKDKTTVTAMLPADAKEGLDVAFSTTMGVFTDNNLAKITVKTKKVLRNGKALILAEVELKNGLDEGTIEVEAKLASTARQLELSSTYNYPSAIALTTTTLTLQNDATSQMEISCQLDALSGTVTEDHPVTVEVRSDDYATILGSFIVLDTESDSNGKCHFLYSLVPDTLYTGILHVITTTSQSGGVIIGDTLNIYAID